jgi:acid phosphatase type 7
MRLLRWVPVLIVGVFLVAGCSSVKPPVETEFFPGTIHPYLQIAGPGDDPVLIWTSDRVEPSRVMYGFSGGLLDNVVENNDPVRNHFVPLTGLDADTEYDYQVESPEAQSSVNTFRTLPETKADGTSDPFTMVAYGDNRSNPDLHERVINQIISDGIPSLVVSSGDLVYSGRDSIRWFREFLIPADRLFSAAPVMISLGNHDLDTSTPSPRSLAQWWLDRFSFPGQPTDVGYGRWFSYEAGGIHLIHLDSTEPDNMDQLAWLKADLKSPESVQADFIMAVFHHPPYSSGGHGSNENVREVWETLLMEHGVDLVFNGHNHFYQRTLPSYGGGPVVETLPTKNGVDFIQTGSGGVVYLITGGGGAPLYTPKPADFVAVNAKQRHFIRVEYVPGEVHCTVINEDGMVIDEFIVGHNSFIE